MVEISSNPDSTTLKVEVCGQYNVDTVEVSGQYEVGEVGILQKNKRGSAGGGGSLVIEICTTELLKVTFSITS